jgi:phosphoribosylglycinamide formyltransferase-1
MSIKLAILVSGRGSNMESILQEIKEGTLDATVEIVISNNPEAYALPVARKYGVHAIAVDHRGISRAEHERLVLQELSQHQIDYVVLAGYMRLITEKFLSRYKDPSGYYRIINIHPSYLPAFPGANAYEEAFTAGVKKSGITVHLVNEQMDSGPILAQKEFERHEDDTLETFKARGLAVEHELYPQVLGKIAKQGLSFLPPVPAQKKAGATR